MVREMIGGCCVCLDERGWNENPLVYCDGSGCNVAVHQACYGIVKVPSGPWFCCKCRSQERIARVKCELCPNKEGALKRTDSGGWAHVVCALYIPEVRFGDVGTMEPIIFSSIPHERFIKTCFICEENGRESKSVNGACMNCHKPGCKLSFHVTCAQSRRQLCEEASVNGHVQYVGYCTTHWTRRFKQPPLIPVNNSENADEKKVLRKGRSRNDSTSSTNSTDMPKSRGRKQKNTDLSPDTRTTIPEIKSADVSPARAEDDGLAKQTQESLSNKATVPSSQAKLTDSNSNSFSVNGILTNEKLKGSSPLNTPVPIFPKQDAKISEESTEASIDNITDPVKKVDTKKRKLNEKEKGKKKPKIKVEKEERDKKKIKFLDSKKKEKSQSKDKEKVSEKKQKFPQPSRLGLVENGKVSSWESVTPKYSETPDNFQDFLEHQWNQTVHFMTSKAEHFDVASLLACLHQLKSDNLKLEKKLMNAQARRDRLLGVNARLAASFTDATPDNGNGRSPLSAMLSKLNDKPDFAIPSQKDGEKAKKSPETKTLGKKRPVASPDLAMLAAASVKLESENSGKVEEGDKTNSEKTNSDTEVPLDEKPPSFNDQVNINSMLLQPTVTRHGNDSLISSSFDRLLNEHRNAYAHMNLFSDATEVDQETSSSRV